MLAKSEQQYHCEKYRNKFLHVIAILGIFQSTNPELINAHHLKQIFTTEVISLDGKHISIDEAVYKVLEKDKALNDVCASKGSHRKLALLSLSFL
jgi:hypothetical protein